MIAHAARPSHSAVEHPCPLAPAPRLELEAVRADDALIDVITGRLSLLEVDVDVSDPIVCLLAAWVVDVRRPS